MGKISEIDHHHPHLEYLYPYTFGIGPHFADRPPTAEQKDLENIAPCTPCRVLHIAKFVDFSTSNLLTQTFNLLHISDFSL